MDRRQGGLSTQSRPARGCQSKPVPGALFDPRSALPARTPKVLGTADGTFLGCARSVPQKRGYPAASSFDVTGYRLYFFEDATDGRHIRARAEFDATDDDEAIRKALERADGRLMELWCGRVFLMSWPPQRRTLSGT